MPDSRLAGDYQNVTELHIELAMWSDVYRETVLRSGSTSYCDRVIAEIKSDIKQAEQRSGVERIVSSEQA